MHEPPSTRRRLSVGSVELGSWDGDYGGGECYQQLTSPMMSLCQALGTAVGSANFRTAMRYFSATIHRLIFAGTMLTVPSGWR